LVLLPSAARAFEPSVFIVVPQAPAQGDIVRFTMDMPHGASTGSVTLAGRKFGGFVTGGLLNAYVGIDLDTAPGTHTVAYEFSSGDKGEREISVTKREFATEQLTVDSKYTDLTPADLERANSEKARIEALWSVPPEPRRWTKSFVKPADGPNGSPFGLRRYFNGQPRSPHLGLDIKAPKGAPVYVSNSGRVVLAEELFFTGNTVVVDHGLGLFTFYAHLSSMSVKVGEDVDRSQLIGHVGATGRATGPHLHWAVNLGGARVDPAMLPGMIL
jgi:murein DD-endopeptidase MepM/ murein hydrolase activator NlpD